MPEPTEQAVITLTSIPPRFAALGDVLASLTRQGAARVVLCLPLRYRDFPGPVTPPQLPGGVKLLWSGADHGPATKLLPALQAFPDAPLVYCDDDCLYAAGWLEALCAEARVGQAVAASGWSVARLKRQGAAAPFTDIAQGFSGVLVRREMLHREVFDLPESARSVDDIWLSGMIAASGTPLRLAPEARARVTPLNRAAPLQHRSDRAIANTRAANHIAKRFGIWPPLA